MIELTEINLGQRQKELNTMISDTAKNKINFDEIKSMKENSDVDKLYKIGVASKYNNAEYLIDILKTGDSLYISKALKCIWIYGDEYSHIINPENLHENIFPLMSLKMTKKFLITISMYVSGVRVIDFYNYCKKMKYAHIAMKFLLFTPETFKLDILNDENVLCKLRESNELLKFFLGNSFDLAVAYYNTASEYNQANVLYQLRHFYSISDVKYLELLRSSTCHWSHFKRTGLKISKDIMTKHKHEIYKKPMMYLYLLNKSMLTRYSTVDDAKFYVKTLISHECPKPMDFWNTHFCEKYAYILDKIPLDQRLQFIKNIFIDHYPNEEFEMSIHFYNAKLYTLLTPEEREKWAIRHIQSDLELLGSGRDFLWYRFVSFSKAFVGIKKYVQIAVNTDVRTEITLVLVESAKTDSDLETLFVYYYKRHVNEQKHYKERFVDAILSEHNIYNFGDNCWNAFNKILFSLDVYSILECFSCRSDYKNVALIYYIIHGKEVPEVLNKYIDLGIYMNGFKAQTDKLTEDKAICVYQYLFQYYIEKIKSFEDNIYDNEIKYDIRKYIQSVLDLMYQYKQPKEDISDIINKYIRLDFEEFRHHLLLREDELKLTQRRLIGYLKDNKELVISNLHKIKNEMNTRFKMNTFLKILRMYFSNDLAKVFLRLFKEILVEENPRPSAIKITIYGIIELADMDFKIEFLGKYVPEEEKIDPTKVDRKLLCIQKSICKMVCYSRPPVPLTNVMKFIIGDYVQFCLPMFNLYLTNLSKPLSVEFVKSLPDRPLSVQNIGLQMAFECFSTKDFRKIILELWNNTIDVSSRSVIYTCLYNKIRHVEEHDQNELFEDLKLFTRSLDHQDDGRIFTLITSDCLPHRFIGEYIEIVWNVVDSLPAEEKVFIERRNDLIDYIYRYIYFIKKEVIESIIYDHVDVMLKQGQIKQKCEKPEKNYLIQSKWSLLHEYVTFFTDENDFHKKAELVMVVIKESIKMWDEIDDDKYILIEFVSDFLIDLNNNSYDHDFKNYAKANVMFEQILKELQNTLSPEEVHDFFWASHISIITRNVISDGKRKLEHVADLHVTITECLNTFAKEFASQFIELVKNQKCFVSLFDVIQDELEIHVRKILAYLNYSNNNVELRKTNTFILVCLEILEYDSFETHMFAAKLLPWTIHHCINREEYLKVISKLQSSEFTEVKFFIYRKFVKLDYTIRGFILPQRQRLTGREWLCH